MKKFFHYFIIGITAVSLLSCAKEIANPENEPVPGEEAVVVVNPNAVPMVFNATKENPDTKSNISGNSILWEDSDKIAIFDGTALNEFTASSVSGTGASFSGSAEPVSEYYAVAPYEAATNLSTANTRISITVPHNQVVIGSHCVDSKALVSTAVASGTTDLDFENQFALMKVKITKSNIIGVTVKGNNDESIAGSAHFYYAGDGAPKVDLSNAGQKSVNLTYKATASSSNSAFPTGDYYIVIWPKDFPSGYSVIITDEDGGISLKSTSAAQSFSRNGGQNLSTIDDATFCPSVIMNAAQLKMWRRLAEAGVYSEGDEVKLGADIDLAGYTWKPVTEFLGVFDGQGHKIYNFTVSSDVERVGFIGTLGSTNGEAAELKNVIFGSSNGSSADGSSSITAVGASSRYVGIVGYPAKNSSISNVTNFVPITMGTDVNRGKHYTGGIAGGTASGVSISGCTNKAPIVDNSAFADFGGSAIGGISGNMGDNVHITSCVNEGTVTNNCGDVAYIGGIAGLLISTTPVIEECSNSGKISNMAASLQELNSDNTSKVGGEWQIGVGGIAGCIGNASIIKCSNSAEVIQIGVVEESGAYARLVAGGGSEVDSRPCIGGIVGVACRTGAKILGCTNSGRPRIETNKQYCAAMGGIVGATSNANKTCTVLITKADDGTKTVNNADIDEKNSRGAQTQYSCYMGGIVGIGASSNLTISFCENNGNIFTSQSQNQGTFRCGGIAGMVYISTLTDCVNNGRIQVHGGGTSVTAQCGGICGGSYGDYPKILQRCTNNGEIGLYKVKNGSTVGGILAEWNPKQTDVIDCISSGKITTGNMNSYPTDRNAQTVQDVEFGGLFGRVRSGNSAQAKVCEGCIVNCEMLVNGTSMKYKGLLFGRHYDDKKVTIGSSASPVMITTGAKILVGANANPESPTTVSFSNLSDTYPYIQGASCRAYSTTDGTSDTGKLELHLSLVTPAQAGIN